MQPMSKAPKGYQATQVANYDPQQMQLYQNQFQYASPDSYTSRLAGGSQEAFQPMEEQAMRDFNRFQGQTASRFTKDYGMGATKSTGFQNIMGEAGKEFAGDLASRRHDMRRQAIQDLMGMSNQLLGQQPTTTYFQPKKQSFLQKLLGGGLPLAGAGLGAAFGGPLGMAIGGSLGSAAGSAFGGGDYQNPDWSQFSNLSTKWGQ